VQLFRDGLRERRSDVLANLRLAGENRDAAIFPDVQPCGDLGRAGVAVTRAAAGFLRVGRFVDHAQNNDAASESGEEIATRGGRGHDALRMVF